MSLKSKLYWRCRRGMKELDIVMLRYLDHHYDSATPQEQAVFERIVEMQDPELWLWVSGREAPQDPQVSHVLAKMLTMP